MPEGPEIRRTADNLEAAIRGKPLIEVWFAFPQLMQYQLALLDQTVTCINSHGKVLLTHFSGGLTLYSHNQLYGIWRIVEAGTIPEMTTRMLRVKLQTAEKAILLYSASDIKMLTAEQLATHSFLQRLGPDVLDVTLTPKCIRARLVLPRFRNRQFSSLLLDQTFLAGLGNYLRAEILWQVGLTAQHKASELSNLQLDTFSHALLDIPRLSYRRRITTPEEIDETRHYGALFHFKVFQRDGKTCYRCGEFIEKTIQSSRPFYWCPGCQK